MLSRKAKGSANREKARKKVARAHARITDRRCDFLHKLTTRLVRENQTVVIEDLNVRGMVRNHSLARAISDAAWHDLRSMLEYKCDWYGRDLVVIDRWFPSSKMCSACGHLKDRMPLNERVFRCDRCTLVLDRNTRGDQHQSGRAGRSRLWRRYKTPTAHAGRAVVGEAGIPTREGRNPRL